MRAMRAFRISKNMTNGTSSRRRLRAAVVFSMMGLPAVGDSTRYIRAVVPESDV